MLFDTSVTIVVISPSMTQGKWIDWEIKYSLREYSRNGETSHSNGLGVEFFDNDHLCPIVVNNRCNQLPKKHFCEKCQLIDWLEGPYIALAGEGMFLANPSRYIENAYNKSQRLWNYDPCMTRQRFNAPISHKGRRQADKSLNRFERSSVDFK